ncbi:MAG: RcpC/CpaB family pilus assembly protein [Elusimicrobiales bacterium]
MKTIAIAVLLAAAPAAAGDQKEAASPEAPQAQAALVKGYRGTTLPVPGHQLLFLKKGDRVDVLVTFDAKMKDKDKKERKEKITASILQNVVVVNIEKPAKLDEAGAIELLLNPNEAQYAALSISQGTVSITVRAPGDTELHQIEMASFRKLIR